MIQFSKHFRFRETIWPICLPDKAELDQNAYEDIGMVLAAYGTYAEELGGQGEVLTEVFTGQNDKFCSAIYRSINIISTHSIIN